MSELIRGIIHTAASSQRHLTVGTVADPVRLSWREVHDRARRMAGGLAAQRVGHHSTVVVLANDPEEVAPLTQAIWLRGAAVTMLQQPTPRSDLTVWLADTVRAIRMIKADLVVVGAPFLASVEHLAEQDLAACAVGALCGATPIEPDEIEDIDETDVALRQLTSGSTGMPKAVEITHGNINANALGLRDALNLDVDTDVAVSWLPLSHDMGMIAFMCVPMQLGIEAVIVPPQQFLTRPLIWAELISKHRATITSGPNFAYSVLTRVLASTDPNDIDLSSLRVAINGAEPIDHRDMSSFAAVGARFGLRPSALMPGYGMAEATLVVSLGAADEGPVVDRVSRRAVAEDHRAQPARADADDVQHVACVGHPVTGMEVRITRDGKPVAARDIGAIELRGPAIAKSYITSDGVVPLACDDGWFDAGDLGYLDEQGRIYVCGRTKDLIVLAGRNLYPHDIERAAEGVEDVRKGCVIALRLDGEREGFAILAEVRNARDEDNRRRIGREIAARVSSHVGHLPREVRLFPAGTLPKTPSGKLRRSSACDLLSEPN